MSYVRYEVQCDKCKVIATTAFGIVGTTIIAEPIENCECGGKFKRMETENEKEK